MLKMYYRINPNDTITEALTAETLPELFTACKKLEYVEPLDCIRVNVGATALAKMQGAGFLARSPLAQYAFGSLGFTNALTATALLAAVNYGADVVLVGTNIQLDIVAVNHLPQGDYIHFIATARNCYANRTATLRLTLAATFTDSTAEAKHARNSHRAHNCDGGYIPLRKTENDYEMHFCDNIYIGGRSGREYGAFSFTAE